MGNTSAVHTTRLDKLLARQRQALGRHLKPTETFARVMRRQVGGRLYSECVRRISPPDRYRDDVSVNGEWRFSEAFDGACAWYLERHHLTPQEATGRALAAQRWSGTLLDHLRPLSELRRLGCTLRVCGLESTARGQALSAVQISMLDYFAETVFIDESGRIAAYHMDLPEAGEEERELEVCADEWGQHDGLYHPVRATVLDRNTGEIVAEIIVSDVYLELYSAEVFNLTED